MNRIASGFAAALALVAGVAHAASDIDWTKVDEAMGRAGAVQAAGVVDTLKGPGPFTVFAPTDDAFAKLPAGTVDTLLKPENKDMLTKILTYHVVPTKAMSDAINKMVMDDGGKHEVTTVSGGKLTVMSKDGKISIMDEKGQTANVTIADVSQSNGVIHVIDSVLLPM